MGGGSKDYPLPKTNRHSHWEWAETQKERIIFPPSIFRGYVSFREGICYIDFKMKEFPYSCLFTWGYQLKKQKCRDKKTRAGIIINTKKIEIIIIQAIFSPWLSRNENRSFGDTSKLLTYLKHQHLFPGIKKKLAFQPSNLWSLIIYRRRKWIMPDVGEFCVAFWGLLWGVLSCNW